MQDRLDASVALIAERHHGLFALHHLAELRFTRETRAVRLESGRWLREHDGVFRMAGVPKTWRSDLLAACWAGGTRALASHRSAAALWSLPSGRTDVVELTCPRWQRARHDELVVHESTLIDDVDRTSVEQIPCTTPERTLFDLARIVRPVLLDANVDSALRRHLVSIEDLRRTATRLATQGRPGGSRFRDIVDARSGREPNAESVPERLLADMLVRQGFSTPTLQYEVRGRGGEFVARVDLAYPELGVLIEYDSFEHHTGKIALVRDSARRNALTELGFFVLTATAADLRDRGDRLARSIRRIRERAA